MDCTGVVAEFSWVDCKSCAYYNTRELLPECLVQPASHAGFRWDRARGVFICHEFFANDKPCYWSSGEVGFVAECDEDGAVYAEVPESGNCPLCGRGIIRIVTS